MYKINLPKFEGPLDLLLFFIKRDELDIYDIPISQITSEFIEYVKLIEKLDLEIAGDFILMASTLMQIKARMLLPKEVDEKGTEIDPRAELVAALLEYKRFKEMSDEFSYFEANQRKVNFRGNFELDPKEKTENVEMLLKNISVYDLMKAFKKAIEEKPKEPIHEIVRENFTIEEQADFILDSLIFKSSLTFVELVKTLHDKIQMIVTFIAILELVRSGKIGLRESQNFNDFEIVSI